jgi:hypothetical protein
VSARSWNLREFGPLVLALLMIFLGALPAAAQDELFVANIGNNSITVYSRAATGNTAPLRTLSGAATGLNEPEGLVVDAVHQEILVVNTGLVNPPGPSITVYSLTASGNTLPLRTLAGPSTGLLEPTGLALDLAHDEILVMSTSAKAILAYSRAASGDSPPLRTIAGPATGLNAPVGLAVDPTNDEIIVANTQASSILVFSRTANGNVAPLRTIVGAATGLVRPTGLALDTVNSEIFVSNDVNIADSITVYSRTANGNVPPLRTLLTNGTTGRDPSGLALDLANNELFVSAGCCVVANNAITVYSRTASGSATPLRVLNGPSTGLNSNDLGVALASGAPPAGASLVAAVLPSSRSVQVGTTATVFATIINTSVNTALNANIALASGVAVTFKFNTTDCSTNAVTGSDNAGVNIAPGAAACFVLSLTPLAPFLPTEVAFAFAANNAPPAATLVGINTLLMTASATPVPDIIALAGTSSNDGIVHATGPAMAGAFAVATSNVGASAFITASANTGSAVLPVTLAICQTNPVTGACLAPPGSSVPLQINAGDTPTFGIFVFASAAIPLDPANSRIFVIFTDAGGVVRGRTSVAVETQ